MIENSEGEDKPRRINDCDISDVMSAAVSQQYHYGFIFASVGDIHGSLICTPVGRNMH